jgi:hypothetical protein
MKMVYIRVMIAPPSEAAYTKPFTGMTIEDCIQELDEYLETTEFGTRASVVFAGYTTGESYEVTR